MEPDSFSADQLIKHARFSHADLKHIHQCWRAHNRLGFGYQLAHVRLKNYFPNQNPFK